MYETLHIHECMLFLLLICMPFSNTHNDYVQLETPVILKIYSGNA